jgi:hypothetical protein
MPASPAGRSFDSGSMVVTTSPVGTATMTFLTCFDATLDCAFTGGELAGVRGSIDLTRLGAALTGCPLALSARALRPCEKQGNS